MKLPDAVIHQKKHSASGHSAGIDHIHTWLMNMSLATV